MHEIEGSCYTPIVVVRAYVVYTRCHITYTMVRAIESPRDRDREKREVATSRVEDASAHERARQSARVWSSCARRDRRERSVCIRHPSPVTRRPSSPVAKA